MRAVGRLHRDGLGIDAEGVVQRGGHLLLNHRATCRREIAADGVVEGGRVHLDVLSFLRGVVGARPAQHRILMARAAAVCVEERAEPGLRRENGGKDTATDDEPRLLRG